MKTIIKSYYFDCHNSEENQAYQALAESLRGQGLDCLCSHGGESHYSAAFKDGREIELETTHIFNNQWNTAPIAGISDSGLRVFDWAEDYPINFSNSIKRGHYLVITDEMREIRRNTHKCGYCGAYEPAPKGYVFCPHCLGSEYLKPSDLKLTRMRPVCDSDKPFPELTEGERAHLMPLYKDAQINGNNARSKARLAKAREDIKRKHDKTIRDAETEFAGFSWLMDLGINPSLAIFYTHTGRFGFGWNRPVDAELLSTLLDCISEFPFPYDIKTVDGRTLSGG